MKLPKPIPRGLKVHQLLDVQNKLYSDFDAVARLSCSESGCKLAEVGTFEQGLYLVGKSLPYSQEEILTFKTLGYHNFIVDRKRLLRGDTPPPETGTLLFVSFESVSDPSELKRAITNCFHDFGGPVECYEVSREIAPIPTRLSCLKCGYSANHGEVLREDILPRLDGKSLPELLTGEYMGFDLGTDAAKLSLGEQTKLRLNSAVELDVSGLDVEIEDPLALASASDTGELNQLAEKISLKNKITPTCFNAEIPDSPSKLSSFKLRKGEVSVITGAIGSGKTRFLESLHDSSTYFAKEVPAQGTLFDVADLKRELKDEILLGNKEKLLEQTVSGLSSLYTGVADKCRLLLMLKLNQRTGDELASLASRKSATFAAACCSKKKVLLLDQTLSLFSEDQIETAFTEIKRRKLTAVIVSHDKKVFELADRVYGT